MDYTRTRYMNRDNTDMRAMGPAGIPGLAGHQKAGKR
jgi:hypothetical protein